MTIRSKNMKPNKKRATREELYDLVQSLEFLPDNWRDWPPRDRKLFCSEAAQRLLNDKKRFERISQEASDAFWRDIHEACSKQGHVPQICETGSSADLRA
jgi:hypothetical protein